MASWQDIRELEVRIYEVVDEYIHNAEAYQNPVLIVSQCDDREQYAVEVDDMAEGANSDDGTYPMSELVRTDDTGLLEPDVDKISDIANSWLFLD